MQRCDCHEECFALLPYPKYVACYREEHDSVEGCRLRAPMRCGHPYLHRRSPQGNGPWCAKCDPERALREKR